MKVIFAIRALTGHGGGAEKVFSSVLLGLISKDYSFDVLSFDRSGQTFYDCGGKSIKFLSVINPHRSMGFFDFFRLLLSLRLFLRKQKPAIVVGFMYSTYFPILIASIGLNISVICCEHATSNYMLSSLVRRLAAYYSDIFCKRKVFVSLSEFNSYSNIIAEKMLVIPNPVDPIFLKNRFTLSNDFSSDSQDRSVCRLLFVGTLREEKNLRSLIDALSFVTLRSSFTLDVIGDGPLRVELFKLIDSLGLGSVVSFHGSMDSQKICDFYDRSDLCVIPSRYESFSLVAVESLARGLPVLSFSRCSGVLEHVVHGGNGFLIDSEKFESDCSALAWALETLKSKELIASLAKGASSFDASRFSLEEITDQWVRLLNDCKA